MLAMSIEGEFELDKLLSIQQMQLVSPFYFFFDSEPDSSIAYIIIPCLKTDLCDLVKRSLFDELFSDLFRKRRNEISTICLIEAIFDICALRVGHSHQIILTQIIVIVNRHGILSP
jgi:hypothetical protein